MFGIKAMSGVRDLTRGGNLATRVLNLTSKKTELTDFALDAVLRDASRVAGVAEPANPSTELDHYRWWKKLCQACGDKPTTAYGGQLLRSRLVNALAQRLAIDEHYRLNGKEIEKQKITEPIVVMGLPRSNGHFAAHVLSSTGLFSAPKQCDTYAPSLMMEEDRIRAFDKQFRFFRHAHPDFMCVRVLNKMQLDDDLTLHLMTPQSLAWGLLHGLDDYLLESLEEDQTPVYAQVKKTLQLLQWYQHHGHLTSPVPKEFEPIDNPMEVQRYGPKTVVLRPQWVLYSPFAILSSDAVNEVFPDMKAIWVHRALSQCIPSLCSSLCLHNALYTGKPPTDAQLALTGEKVMGIFGSGAEYAIEYYGGFDQKTRMVHWSNRDVKRHCSRLVQKTLAHFGIHLDRFRRIQMINGQSEYIEKPRPLHDSQLPYFALHEGAIGEVFQDYIYQFEEFAFEKRFGVDIQENKSLTKTSDSLGPARLGSSTDANSGSIEGSKLGLGHYPGGHFLQGEH